jgi:hypothetical protein
MICLTSKYDISTLRDFFVDLKKLILSIFSIISSIASFQSLVVTDKIANFICNIVL